jgi:3-hydroxyisobutyrate dehydrogenase-like beta-hydroxyacid dehydrogenase
VSYLGPVGRGQEAKLINNLLSIANFGLSSLALELGEQLNFDRAQLRDALMVGSAQSFALQVVPRLLDWSGGNTVEALHSRHQLLEKDVNHSVRLVAEGNPVMLPLETAARAMLDCIDRLIAARSAPRQV